MVVSVHERGRLTLPKEVWERMNLRKASRLDLKMVGDHIELYPMSDSGNEDDEDEITLTRQSDGVILVGFPGPVDAAAAVKAEREARDEVISQRVIARRQ